MKNKAIVKKTKRKLPELTQTVDIDYKGDNRTYCPDFLINNEMIEVKPEKLHNSPAVLKKKLAAENYCNANNLSYKLIDPPILSTEEVKILYLDKKIKFLDRYDKKFKERFMSDAENNIM